MATAILSNDDFQTNTDDKNLEIFSLIWLDKNVNVKDIRDTEQKLRSIINHLKKFQDLKQCQKYIEQRSKKDRLILIVSDQLGREIVPSIHNIQQVMSIYVYCMDKKSNEEWACKFAKVKSVIVELDELISRIIADHKIQKNVEEPLSINISITNIDGDRKWKQDGITRAGGNCQGNQFCCPQGIFVDDDENIYVADSGNRRIGEWKCNKTNGQLVAGGNGKGDNLNQFNVPTSIFIDEDDSLYVSDEQNHRVMKWLKDAKEGIVAAGGNDEGNSLTQMSHPEGVIVDQLGQIYVVDYYNHRVMRWCRGAKEGMIVAGENRREEQSNQFKYSRYLSFDRQGNLYVIDCWNNRIQKFEIN